MKSISTLFRQLSLIVVLISAFSLSAWGKEVTAKLTFDNTSKRTSFSTTQQVWKENGITFTNNKAKSTSNIANYSNPVRLYANSEIIIEAPGNITQITATANSSSYATELKNSVGDEATASGSNVTIKPTASSTSYTIAKLTAQVRLNSITVTYEGGGEPIEYMITFGDNEPIKTTDGKITKIPTAPTTPCNPTYTTFIGWTKDATFGKTGMEPETIDETTVFYTDTQLYPVYSKETDGGFVWSLVTNTATLAVGDKIVIAAKEYDFALSTTQNGNNRGQAAITKNGNTITFGNDVQILTLEKGNVDSTFAFNTGNGYLYAASISSNYLRTETKLSNNSSWKITIANGVATVVAQGSNTKNTMQYNQSSSLFACYGSASQKAIALYKGSTGKVTEYFICCNVVESDKTINIDENITFNTLTIKSNLDEAGQVAVTSGSLTAQKVVVEKTIDASRYFFFSLPFDCNIRDIVATDAKGNLTYYDNYTIFYYDQKYAAEKKDNSKAWKEIEDQNTTLKANQGYIIGYLIDDEGEATIKFPSANAQTITITAPITTPLDITDYTWYTENTEKQTQCGWNLIGMPYYQNINSTISCDSVYIYYSTTPNKDGKTYTQEKYTGNNVAPFTSFFVQVTAAPTFTITETQSVAPMLRAKDVVTKATITLTDANGGMDKTTIINNPTKTTDYEIGHDLVKWIGYAEIPQIYSIQGEDILAFNSLAMNNETIIPLGVYAHADGDYTFSLSDKSMGNLEGWELYDSESGKAVALTDESLTVTLSKGTHEGRFSIRMEQGTTTDCECDMSNIVTYMNNGTFYIENMPAKAMVYIYDAVGRMIYATETTDTSFDYTFALRGVYNVVVCTEYNSIAYKTIY